MASAQIKPLEEAIHLAVRAHCGQLDPDGTPHIVHCFEVMFEVKKRLDTGGAGNAFLKNVLKYFSREQLLTAAILHDTVEDSFGNPTALEIVDVHRLHVQFGEKVAYLVEGVTRQQDSKGKNEAYKFLIYRAKENDGRTLLKDCDLTVNLNRNHTITDEKWAQKLSRKYLIAKRVLASTTPTTWEAESWQMRADADGKQHYFIDDGNGREMEVSERKFARLIGSRKKESVSAR